MAKILIVEDDENNRELLSMYLTESGYEALAVNDGAESLEAVRHEKPDLVLMDLRMPKMNGIEATKKIKADPDVADTPILMLTGVRDTLSYEDMYSAGAVGYLGKPVDLVALVERVEEILK